MRHRSKSSFYLPLSSLSSSLSPKTRTGRWRILLLFLSLLSLYSLYSISTKRRPPPEMPFVDFQRSWGYKKNYLQHGVYDLCKNIKWKENVYLDCYARVGTFNAINFVQTCFREAMDAGMGIVRPQIYTRDTHNLSILDGPLVDLDYLLDEEFLWKSLEVSCPQMKVVEPEIKKTGKLIEIGGDFTAKVYYRGDFDKLITKKFSKEISSSSSSSPLIIRNKYCLLQWNVDSDSKKFQIGFRNMFQLHPRYEKVAVKILDKLPYNFIGIHLRVESDFIEVDRFEEELLEIVDDAKMEKPIIYLASGELNRTLSFKRMAKNRGVEVVDKWAVIDKEIEKGMEGMDFDQMAIVDYIVLHHSQYFKGAGLSSFSYSLVISRYFYQFDTIYYNPHQYVLGRQSQITEWINFVFVNAMW